MKQRSYPMDEDDVMDRAIGRWFRDCEKIGAIGDQPSRSGSYVEWDEEKNCWMVELHNVRGLLEAYEARENAAGALRFKPISHYDEEIGERVVRSALQPR